jgi:hypothetical protein
MRNTVLGTAALAMTILGACGPSTTTTETSEGATTTSGGEGGVDPGSGGVETLLVDVIAPHICESMRGSFIGLPGEGGTTGPASGSDPTVGRWWIRECSAAVDGDALRVSINGTGWTWIDRESMGFRVRQYLRFDAHAAFSATMQVGYDRPARIATIWMHPGGEVDAGVTPRGLVQVESTNVLSGMIGGLLELTGSSASQRAQQQVAEEGSARLRERFSAGFTVTFSMANEQMDFMVGALERGQVPVRPYADETGVTWSVNQRMQIWPGGLDVLGPTPVGRGQQALDLELEEGEGLIVDATCQADFERFYDQTLQGGSPPPPTGTRVMEFSQSGQAQRALIPELGCPTLLLVQPRSGATMPARMRIRVTPASAPTQTALAQAAATAAATTGTTAATTAPAAPVRIQLTSMMVSPTNSGGSRWDTFGGEPDPYVIIVSIPGQREVERTQVVSDQHEVAAMDHWLPGAFRPEDMPLRFSVYDDDPVGGDELVGVADLSAAQITAAAGTEIHLELRSQDTVPRAMGTIRLRAQPMQ